MDKYGFQQLKLTFSFGGRRLRVKYIFFEDFQRLSLEFWLLLYQYS